MFVGGQQVTCAGCGREYVCTALDDYYNNTTTKDGVCTACLLDPEMPKGAVDPLPPEELN